MTSQRFIWLVLPIIAIGLAVAATAGWSVSWAPKLSVAYAVASLATGLAIKVWCDTHPPNDRVPSWIWLIGFAWPVMFIMHAYGALVIQRR